jgi:hypothetical protein
MEFTSQHLVCFKVWGEGETSAFVRFLYENQLNSPVMAGEYGPNFVVAFLTPEDAVKAEAWLKEHCR